MPQIKGFTKLTISKKTEARLRGIKTNLIISEPDTYDEGMSLHQVLKYLIDYHKTH